MTHPGRQDGARPRHLEPGGGVGHRRSQARVRQVLEGKGRGRPGAGPTLPVAEQQVQGQAGLGQFHPQGGEGQRQALAAAFGPGEQGRPAQTEAVEAQQGQPVALGATGKLVPLLAKDLRRESGVGHRVADGVAYQLVVLHQPVIGVLREGQGRQVEGVHHGPPQQGQDRCQGAQGGEVVAQEVVAQKQITAGSEAVQVRQRGVNVEAALALEGPVPPDGADLVDGPVGTGLQVQQEAVAEEGIQTRVHGPIMR